MKLSSRRSRVHRIRTTVIYLASSGCIVFGALVTWQSGRLLRRRIHQIDTRIIWAWLTANFPLATPAARPKAARCHAEPIPRHRPPHPVMVRRR